MVSGLCKVLKFAKADMWLKTRKPVAVIGKTNYCYPCMDVYGIVKWNVECVIEWTMKWKWNGTWNGWIPLYHHQGCRIMS